MHISSASLYFGKASLVEKKHSPGSLLMHSGICLEMTRLMMSHSFKRKDYFKEILFQGNFFNNSLKQ
jgi:hypothetical protein